MTMHRRRGLWGPRGVLSLVGLAALLFVSGCGKGDGEKKKKVYDYTKASGAEGDSKALMYNLIGRWFPTKEVERLDDDSMTPEAWCAREPSQIRVHLDEVEVQCDSGLPHAAAIARVKRHEKGGIQLVLRASEDAPLRTLIFEQVVGTDAQITGSPCFEGKPAGHARFPKIEILGRQILGGRRCAQIRDRAAAAQP